MSTVRNLAFAAAIGFTALGGAVISPAIAEMTVEVGGAPMYPSKNIIENAVNSKDHTMLVAAVKAAVSSRPWKATGLLLFLHQ